MIGENIKKIRENQNISINELSRITGVSAGYISSLERGEKKNPSQEILKKISDGLNVSMSSFFNENEEKIKHTTNDIINPRIRPIIDSLDRAGDLNDEDINEISQQVEFLINLKRKKK